MQRKWKLSACIIGALMSLQSVFSLDVSIQVIQRDPVHSKKTETSCLVEDTIIDTLFEYGYIASNLPLEVIGENADVKKLQKDGIYKCSDGLADYFAMVIVDLDGQASANPETALISSVKDVEWAVYDVVSGKALDSGKIDRKALQYGDGQEGVESLGLNVSSLINESLCNR